MTILTKGGIKTVGRLLQKTVEDLLSIRGFGERRLKDLERELKKLGVALKESEATKEG